MLKLATEATFTRTIKAKMPIGDTYEEQSFKAEYRTIPADEAHGFNFMKPGDQTAFLKRVIVKLDDLGDVEGKPVAYSEDVLELVLKMPWARSPLTNEYFLGVNGAAEGN